MCGYRGRGARERRGGNGGGVVGGLGLPRDAGAGEAAQARRRGSVSAGGVSRGNGGAEIGGAFGRRCLSDSEGDVLGRLVFNDRGKAALKFGASLPRQSCLQRPVPIPFGIVAAVVVDIWKSGA